jgi:ABC-2 type transport system ATP-binding protein
LSNNTLIVNTDHISKTFGKNYALKELNLQVPRGICGFVGRNGAGKTTTIGVLLGLLRPTSGKATVFGLDCWNDSYKIHSKLGVMHETNAYPGGFNNQRYTFSHPHNGGSNMKECTSCGGNRIYHIEQTKKTNGSSKNNRHLSQSCGAPQNITTT